MRLRIGQQVPTAAEMEFLARLRQRRSLPRPQQKAMRGPAYRPRRNDIIKIMVLLHSAIGTDWQAPPKGTSLKTLNEAQEQGYILIRGEFQKRQFRLTELGYDYVERDKQRLQARRL